MKTLLCATALLTSVSAAHAADPFDVPVTAELLDGWQQADGTRVSAIRLTLADGWKTYWRVPGDAGIPPQFDWKGSQNMAGIKVQWPTPKVFDQNGMRSVGYSNQVILPLVISAKNAAQPVDLELSMDIGVCADICVPEKLTLSGTMDAQSATPVSAIAAALAERPYSASEAGAGNVTCTMSPSQDGLNITATLQLPSTGGTEHVVIETGRDDVWVSEAVTSRNGKTLTATSEMVPVTTGALGLDRSAMRFTVLGSSYAVDLHGCTSG
ncbi:protein-disulfide reductase DsbD domain-containing protein [Sulfitobacter sp.]|uniref:protein-disulfide reductase DsbD domain-containing protein n=1 Tax=Sulfitobacter sp. TaxID=1903071 RepID=UPI003296ED37